MPIPGLSVKYLILATGLLGLALVIMGCGTDVGDKVDVEFDWRSDWAVPSGISTTIDTEGYDFPTAIAFVPNPGAGPKDVLYFVT